MKARNKVTGEVVRNFGWSKEYGTISYIGADGCLHNYSGQAEDWEILDESETDWAEYRREAAKDMACSIVHSDIATARGEDFIKNVVRVSIDFADELIKQLQSK